MARQLVKPIRTFIPNERLFPAPFNGARFSYVHVGSKSGWTVDSFKSKLRDSIYAGSPYTLDAFRLTGATPLAARITFDQITGLVGSGFRFAPWSGDYVGYFSSLDTNALTHVATSSAAIETEALSRVYSNFRSSYEGFNSLNFLGELGESLRMLRNPASALAANTGRFLDTLKSTRKEVRSRVHPRKSDTPQSLRLRRMNSVKDAMAGSWLEFAFGWTPLVNDVKDIAETAGRALAGQLPNSRFTGTSRSPTYIGPKYSLSTTVLKSSSPIRVDVWSSQTSVASTRYVAIARNVRSGPAKSLSDLAILSGFTIENIVPTAYQLAPWSFLIDYFLNLGDVLEAWCTDTSSVFSVSKTVRQQTEFSFYENLYQLPNRMVVGGYRSGLTVGNSFAVRNLTRTTLTRTVSTSLPLPSLQTSIPGIDSLKWVNMAALLAQAKAFRF